VAIADNLGGFELAQLGAATTARLREVLAGARIDRLVDIHNPLDVTPMANDATFTAAADAILDDPDVDVGLIGCVPLTGALATLPKGAGHGEDLAAPGALAARLAVLWQHTTKPWAAVVDAGALYDPFVARLEESGIPVFRAADRALARLNALGAAAPGPALPRPDGTPHG
jgi:acyl-CoA synthetase (NDP forming)